MTTKPLDALMVLGHRYIPAKEYERLASALMRIIARSHNGDLGSSKVIDMRRIAEEALEGGK